MMKLVLGFALLPFWLSAVAALSNVPDQYFGGSDLEGYLAWVDEKGDSYKASSYMEENTQGAAIHWKVENDLLHVAVVARATGWLALGLSEAGGMKGADMVIYETSKPDKLTDAYVLETRAPIVDDCQDWTFVDARQDGGFLIWEGTRKLDTKDTQDRKILDDSDPVVGSQRLIAAWGDEDSFGYHGPKRTRGAVRFYGTGSDSDAFDSNMEARADGYFDLLVPNHEIEPVDTVYQPFCWSWTDLADQGVPQTGSISVVGVQIVLDDVGKPFVHHATLETGAFVTESRTCAKNYFGFLYSYTPGALPYSMPPGTGFTLGPGENGRGTQSFKLVIHYNNPQLLEGFRDNGGIRVYYSNSPVKHELGILPMGDLFTEQRGKPVTFGEEAVSRYNFQCGSACSEFVLDEPVTVIGEYFHMHSIGKAMYNEQIRDGQVIRRAGIDFWDFDQAGVLADREKAFEVQPGDSFSIDCFYDGTKAKDTVFGDSSSEEMCQVYLIYYPAKDLISGIAPWLCTYEFAMPACSTELAAAELNDNVPRIFGEDPLQCPIKDDTDKKSKSSSSSIQAGFLVLVTMVLACLI